MANWNGDKEKPGSVPELLNEREAAMMLRVKAATVRAERIRGKIAYTRIGARIFYTLQQISDYLERQSVPACARNESNVQVKSGATGSAKSQAETALKKRGATSRVSLGTSDFREASLQLAAWVVANERPRKAAPDQVLIETALLNYWNDHAQHLPSANTQRLGLSYWQEFWARRTIADITPHEQRLFRESLANILVIC